MADLLFEWNGVNQTINSVDNVYVTMQPESKANVLEVSHTEILPLQRHMRSGSTEQLLLCDDSLFLTECFLLARPFGDIFPTKYITVCLLSFVLFMLE